MRFVWRNVFLCAGLSVAGCGFAHKPYDNNPLLRDGRAVWPARDAPPANPAPLPAIEPQQPPSPRPAEIAPASEARDAGGRVTSRPE